MAWADLPEALQSVGLLRRSLERGRLGHAYLFSGESPDLLERVARELATTVNCTSPPSRSPAGLAVEACGSCSSCRRIRQGLHPDVHWLRAESKSRVIRVDQVRDLIHSIQLKPTESPLKVGILVAADRLHVNAANAFLKTLEEPPSRSLLILLTTEPDQLLETILSRCLRLVFPGNDAPDSPQKDWIYSLASSLRTEASNKSLLPRYTLLDRLLQHLTVVRAASETAVAERSPGSKHKDVEPSLREQWEEEAKAATEAEYRLRRRRSLQLLQWWLRDVWLCTTGQSKDLLALPDLAYETEVVAGRLSPHRALANIQLLEETQQLLESNVQEALVLEVAMLRLEL